MPLIAEQPSQAADQIVKAAEISLKRCIHLPGDRFWQLVLEKGNHNLHCLLSLRLRDAHFRGHHLDQFVHSILLGVHFATILPYSPPKPKFAVDLSSALDVMAGYADASWLVDRVGVSDVEWRKPK